MRALINDGLVREVGTALSTGGKRRTLLEITPSARCAIGVHLGPESMVFVVTNMAGGMIGRVRCEGTADSPPDLVVQRIASEIDTLILSLGLIRSAVVGIGIAAAGPLDYPAGIIAASPPFDAWATYPLRDELAELTGLPVVVDNDATAAAVGEFWGGRVDAPLSFACLYMGAGIGAGIVINGSAFRGSASNAGEIGHVSLDVNGPLCYCGNRGCLEMLAAPAAVVASAGERGLLAEYVDDPRAALATRTGIMRAFDEIARRAVRREPEALELIQESARYVAAGALGLVNLTDLDLIVLAGPGFAIAGALYVDAIRKHLATRTFARAIHGVEVRFSSNPRDAAALGASALVLQQSLAPRS
ncbi:sugar kinase [Frondihabitans sucicola]|uniref:Sugar kinase n=1 Tax=Frondihabitans sucicola TaxID=1268041 RepID=A0ABN6XYJ7_9MICO|nr:ROK family protein [Frondihabitans sucicola]BDZ48725.1 sugar kinase [Frondihabitans sucicola]